MSTKSYSGTYITKLEARIAELEALLSDHKAERDEYARQALIALSGTVCTPEKGYVIDGGPQLMAGDIRRLCRDKQERDTQVEYLRAENAAIVKQVAELEVERQEKLCIYTNEVLGLREKLKRANKHISHQSVEFNQIHAAIVKQVAELKDKNTSRGWISVTADYPDAPESDRPPKCYLTWDGEVISVDDFDYDGFANTEITHWQPLPAPPTNTNEEETDAR